MTKDMEEKINAIDSNFKQIDYKIKANQVYRECTEKIENGTRFEETKLCEIIENEILKDSTGQFKLTLHPGQKLYRARAIEINDYAKVELGHSVSNDKTCGFNELNSREAPLGFTYDGRNNIKGVSYLYLAEDEVTACAEVKSHLRAFISLASFEVQKPLNIIDFNNKKTFSWDDASKYNFSLASFISNIMLAYSKPIYDMSHYKLTQIITDYMRKTGADGISYRSFYTNKINYTIFNSHKSNISYCDSTILFHYDSNDIFWDFNKKEILQSKPDKITFDSKLNIELLNILNTVLNK